MEKIFHAMEKIFHAMEKIFHAVEKPEKRVGWVCAALAAAACGCASPGGGEGPLVPPPPVRAVSAELAPAPPPPAGGHAWDVLALRAAARSPQAKALLLEAAAERRTIAVDTAWRAPQLRVGIHQEEADQTTPERIAWQTNPLAPTLPARTNLVAREWQDRSGNGYEVGLRLFVANPFVNGWLRRRGQAVAAAREFESHEAAYAVYCEVRSLCLEAAALEEEIRLLERVAELRVGIRDARKRQAEAGTANALDLIEAVARVAAIRSDLRDKVYEQRRVRRQIALLADVPVDAVRLRAMSAEPLPAADGWRAEDLADFALTRRPDLARALRERDAAEHGVGSARAARLPWLDYVEGSYAGESAQFLAYEDYRTGYGTTDRDSAEWQVNVAVSVPVFGWDGKDVRLASARLAAADARARALRDDIRAQVAGALEDYAHARAERDRIADESRQVLAVVEPRLAALADETALKPEDVLATREAVAAYDLRAFRGELRCRRLAQNLESIVGAPLAPAVGN
jgi:outer membrane protein TolC